MCAVPGIVCCCGAAAVVLHCKYVSKHLYMALVVEQVHTDPKLDHRPCKTRV
jgi:energy-converting hydrogenase Eha subunit C